MRLHRDCLNLYVSKMRRQYTYNFWALFDCGLICECAGTKDCYGFQGSENLPSFTSHSSDLEKLRATCRVLGHESPANAW